MYSNCCCSCSFEPEIIKNGLSSHKMYNNNILNFQESTTILNLCTKNSGTLLNAPRNYIIFSVPFFKVDFPFRLISYASMNGFFYIGLLEISLLM